MNYIIDKIIDYLTYSVIGVSFAGAVIFIIKAVIDSVNGWQSVTHHLWDSLLLILIGMIVSGYVFYIKQWSSKPNKRG